MKNGIILLGSSSFLALELHPILLGTGNEVFYANREIIEKQPNDIIQFARERERITVINCLGNRNLMDKNESLISNYQAPLSILHSLLIFNLHWIQLSSYFSKYKEIYGIDKNEYSHAKDLFSRELLEIAEHNSIQVTDLVLPHIISPRERHGRLLRELALHLYRNEEIDVSDCKQTIPVLRSHVFGKFVESIINEIETPVYRYQRTLVPAEFVGELRMIVQAFIDVFAGFNLVHFNPRMNRPNEFSTLNWPRFGESSIDILEVIAHEYLDHCKSQQRRGEENYTNQSDSPSSK